MAVLSKIRERSMFLILVIGLALFAFVLDPSTISDFFNASKVNEIGAVNGETISRQEFAEALEQYKKQTGNRVSEMQAAKTVWNNLLRQKIYKSQLEDAGITVGEEDILKALYEAPGVQNDPRFQTAGIFDKGKLKEHLATIKGDAGAEWSAWQNYMAALRDNIEKSTYDNLVSAGLGASLEEGKAKYFNENTKVTGKFVYYPLNAIPDSLVTVNRGEIKKYLQDNQVRYQVEPSRDVKFVKFEILPTAEDKEAIKKNVADLIEDSENGKGLRSSTDYSLFWEDSKSDIPLEADNFKFKVEVPQVIADKIFEGKEGDVFGPYEEEGYFKISKITEVSKLPDSVQARHILIPFVGTSSADASVTQTEEEAKKTADSLKNVLTKSPAKFAALVKEFSSDTGSIEKEGFYDWFGYNRMVPEFRDFTFQGKKGDLGVVKTAFGFHVIRIEDQKNFQPVVKLVTFGKDIVASEETENTIFQNAETFALDLTNGKEFDDIVKEKKLISQPGLGLKVLDETVPSLGSEREIVRWSFGKDLKIGDFKRFDVKGGYVVVQLTGKAEKGLMSIDKAISEVRPIIVDQKKADLIKEKMSGATLEEIAKSSGQSVRTASEVNLQSPTISGVGYEPKIVAAMLSAKENVVNNHVVGQRGVFAFVSEKKQLPTELPNYNSYRKRIGSSLKNKNYQMYEAVKKASEIEDRVGAFYGIEE